MTLEEQLALATAAVPAQQVNQPTAQTIQPGIPSVPPMTNVQIPVQQPAVQYVQQATQPMQPAPNVTYVQPAQVQPTIDLNKAQQEAETQYAVGTIDFGQKISTRSIEPLQKIEKGSKIRLTVLDKPFFVKVHKHDTLGRLICWSTDTVMGQCCKDLDEPKVRYCMPVLVYCTLPGDPNVALPQGKAELKLMILWDSSSWESISDLIIEKGGLQNLQNLDFIATSEDTYGSLKFKVGAESFRPQFGKDVNAALDKWNNVGVQKAITTVGRQLNDERYLKLTMNATPTQLKDYTIQDID